MYAPLERDQASFKGILSEVQQIASAYLEEISDRPISSTSHAFDGHGLPEDGDGTLAALELFKEEGLHLISSQAGARYFGFVTGGATPASVAGDWLTSAFDHKALTGMGNGISALELDAISMVKSLLGLEAGYTGSFVTGGTMANFVGLAIGRQALGRRQGLDLSEEGLWQAPKIRVLSATPHASILKSLSMLGMGRASLTALQTMPGREALDVASLKEALEAAPEAPTIVVANAGTVNTGDFDDLRAIGALREKYGFWLHVDGAFGGFAAASPKHAHLTGGLNFADSIGVDCHKWLNVPYDSSIQLTRNLADQMDVFKNFAAYLGEPEVRPDNFLHLTPENSRRFRALPAWLSLKAYGRKGYEDIVSRNCAGAKHMGELIEAHSRLELVAPVRLNVFAFKLITRDRPFDFAQAKALVARLEAEGTTTMSPSILEGEAIIRGAVCNWRTQTGDIDAAFEALGRCLPEA